MYLFSESLNFSVKATVGFFWLNAAEAWIDVNHQKTTDKVILNEFVRIESFLVRISFRAQQMCSIRRRQVKLNRFHKLKHIGCSKRAFSMDFSSWDQRLEKFSNNTQRLREQRRCHRFKRNENSEKQTAFIFLYKFRYGQ